jgi:hypothetical protein
MQKLINPSQIAYQSPRFLSPPASSSNVKNRSSSRGRVKSSDRTARVNAQVIASPNRGEEAPKVMSIKQLKDVINDIFIEKFKHDQRCLEARA